MTDTDLNYFVEAGLYDPGADDAELVRALIGRLQEGGWSDAEIVTATGHRDLAQVAFDQHSKPEYTLTDAADMLGVSPEEFDELRRTAGLMPRPFDVPVFTKAEVGAFIGIQHGRSMFTMAEANHFARVLGSSMGRIADAAHNLFLIDVEGPLREAGAEDIDMLPVNDRALASFDAIAAALDPLLRMHMEDAVALSRGARSPGDDPNTTRMAVGFIDLVGFTAFSEDRSAAELGRLVREFEDAAYDIVADRGGRVVKLIGDEVMFVAPQPQTACAIAIALITEFRAQHVTPRGGLAYGELLARGGDYYGPIVNLAARTADLAVPCELLATPEIAALCPDVPFEPAGRRRLKGFSEPVKLVALDCWPQD